MKIFWIKMNFSGFYWNSKTFWSSCSAHGDHDTQKQLSSISVSFFNLKWSFNVWYCRIWEKYVHSYIHFFFFFCRLNIYLCFQRNQKTESEYYLLCSFSFVRYNSNAIEDFKKRLLLEIPDKDLGPSILKLVNK